MSTQSLDRLPAWADDALQGLVFWIGYRSAQYFRHKLPEAALVAELCNLIQARLGNGERLDCERPYRSLIGAGPELRSIGLQSRVDLAITVGIGGAIRPTGSKTKAAVQCVIEVKRSTANQRAIAEDLNRLALVKAHLPETRAFLLVVSESRWPHHFVEEDGKAKRDIGTTGRTGYGYKVRRVCKAASSFKLPKTTNGKPANAHYACLLEVIPHTKKLGLPGEIRSQHYVTSRYRDSA